MALSTGASVLTERSERILDPRRHFREHLPTDDAIKFELPKLHGQRPLADVADDPPQFTEPLGARKQVVNDERLPLAAGHIDSRLNRAMISALSP